MSTSEEYVQAVTDAVAQWRMQENITVSFYSLYLYYVLTTLYEDVAITFPQKWNRGKLLFLLNRYGTGLFVVLQFVRNYRTYYYVSPMGCKALWILFDLAHWSSLVACYVAIGLCLAALLRARPLYVALILALSVTPSCLGLAFNVVGNARQPAEPVTDLDIELGYPCCDTSSEDSLTFVATDIRAYINLTATSLLLVLGVLTVCLRYRGKNSRLVQVLRRDGAVYYLSLTAMRFVAAIFNTPSVIPVESWDSSPASVVYMAAWDVFIPIFAQRLMINMYKIDYEGTRPIASTLLFAPPDPGSEAAQEEFDGENMELNTDLSVSLDASQQKRESSNGLR